jgi:hypothetical protein
MHYSLFSTASLLACAFAAPIASGTASIHPDAKVERDASPDTVTPWKRGSTLDGAHFAREPCADGLITALSCARSGERHTAEAQREHAFEATPNEGFKRNAEPDSVTPWNIAERDPDTVNPWDIVERDPDTVNPWTIAERDPDSTQPWNIAERNPDSTQPWNIAERDPESTQPWNIAERDPDSTKPWNIAERNPDSTKPWNIAERDPDSTKPWNIAEREAPETS